MLASHQSTATLQVSTSARFYTVLFAGILGSTLLYFAAFAHSEALHNGTHDTRHAVVAPCH